MKLNTAEIGLQHQVECIGNGNHDLLRGAERREIHKINAVGKGVGGLLRGGIQALVRGLAWAMEGLLVAARLLPESGYLKQAQKLAQHETGYWSFLFDKPVEEVGISEKGTAAWSLLFYRLYHATGEEQYLTTARKALGWLIDNQYLGRDPDAYGSVVGCSPHSGVVYRPWFNLSCTYTSGFFGLAALEELKLSAK